LDRFPEEPLSATQISESWIRTAVLINLSVPEPQRNDACHRPTLAQSNADFEAVTQGLAQVPKPIERLRRQLMPAARQDHKLVKLTQQLLRVSFLVDNAFPFRLSDSPLDAVFVKSLEYLLNCRPKIESMRTE